MNVIRVIRSDPMSGQDRAYEGKVRLGANGIAEAAETHADVGCCV